MSQINQRRPFHRQTSLQTPPPSHPNLPPAVNNQPSTKPPLIGILRNKQRSEELPDYHGRSAVVKEGQNRAKSALGQLSHQRLRGGVVKVAWGADLNEEEKRLADGSSEREQGFVLNSRKELAERLRIAWHAREPSKRNLNIILTTQLDSLEDNFTIGSLGKEKDDEEAKTRSDLMTNETPGIVVDVTNIFQRTVPKRTLKYERNSYEHNDGIEENKSELLFGGALFQKRSNNPAFNVDATVMMTRPKLVRASSVPVKYTSGSAAADSGGKMEKPTQQQPPKDGNTITVKRRRIKSSSLRRTNKYSAQTTSKTFTTTSAVAANNHVMPRGHKCHQHSKDIVTMVSLLSPNLTDNEDAIDNDDGLVGGGGGGDGHFIQDGEQLNSLRKTVKSVSFQHSVRSFCASFPGRRGSVGTTASTYSVAVQQQQQKNILINAASNKVQEKRGSFSEGNEDGAKPKRRLVRTVSDDGRYTSNETKAPTLASKIPLSRSDKTGNTALLDQLSTSEEAAVETVSDKEAYCLNTYRKLTESGINISLETILRGMLTPTDYRLRCKREEMAARQDGRQNGAGGAEESNMALSNK